MLKGTALMLVFALSSAPATSTGFNRSFSSYASALPTEGDNTRIEVSWHPYDPNQKSVLNTDRYKVNGKNVSVRTLVKAGYNIDPALIYISDPKVASLAFDIETISSEDPASSAGYPSPQALVRRIIERNTTLRVTKTVRAVPVLFLSDVAKRIERGDLPSSDLSGNPTSFLCKDCKMSDLSEELSRDTHLLVEDETAFTERATFRLSLPAFAHRRLGLAGYAVPDKFPMSGDELVELNQHLNDDLGLKLSLGEESVETLDVSAK